MSSFFLWCGVWGTAGSWAKKKQPQNLQTYQQSEVTEGREKKVTTDSSPCTASYLDCTSPACFVRRSFGCIRILTLVREDLSIKHTIKVKGLTVNTHCSVYYTGVVITDSEAVLILL